MTLEFLLRQFDLPAEVPGALFASPMPGRLGGDFDWDSMMINREGIDRVLSLAGMDEIQLKSPAYAGSLKRGDLPWQCQQFHIVDGGVPEDPEAFVRLARDTAEHLGAGERILVHCEAGRGRTGMFVTLVQMALGRTLEDARVATAAGGSGAAVPEQSEFEAWAAGQLAG